MDIIVNLKGNVLSLDATLNVYWLLVLMAIIVSCKAVPVVIDVVFAVKHALVIREFRSKQEAHRLQVRRAKQLANEVFK